MKSFTFLFLSLFLLAINVLFASSARLLDEEPQSASMPATSAGETPLAASPVAVQPGVGSSATATGGYHQLTFFMHDVLGGSNPSARAVTGIAANTALNGQLPFAKNNGGVFPPNGGVPLPNGNNPNAVNNNPALVPFPSGSNTNIGNNAGNQLPFVSAGQLPTGATLENLEFGTITVIDDELTESHELGSATIGKAQGFYMASSRDGSSQTMCVTAMLAGGDYVDTVSFFGVHRTAVSESQVAVIGGTGKYENAKGYASIETLHPVDQHTTDGVETLLHFTVYLSY